MNLRYLVLSKYLAYGYAWVYTLGLGIGFGYLVLLEEAEAIRTGEEAFRPVFFGLDFALALLALGVLLRFVLDLGSPYADLLGHGKLCVGELLRAGREVGEDLLSRRGGEWLPGVDSNHQPTG